MLANAYDYDETGANLTPRTTVNPQANWRLQLTPVLSGALFGGYYYYNADDDEETEIRIAEADAGVIYEPSEVLRFGFGLGYADRTREETDRPACATTSSTRPGRWCAPTCATCCPTSP